MQRIIFSKLNKDLQISRCTIPQHVSATENPDEESADQIIKRQDRFLRLSKSIRTRLSSAQTSQKIQAIGQKYGFELLRLANITRLIREYYFGEVPFQNFPNEIEQRVGVNLLTAQEIARYIKQEIIDWDPWAEYIAKLPKMPIRSIIQQYPHIANTEITAGYIELRNSDELSDPTIKNWVQDYISHLGYEKHSHMEQNEYLFHSENTKNLSSPDREKLGIILKSFDENIALPVDEENGEIIFDNDQGSVNSDQYQSTGNKVQKPMIGNTRPVNIAEFQPASVKQEEFIKPYSPVSVPQLQRETPKLVSIPNRTVPPQSSYQPSPTGRQARPYQGEGARTAPTPMPPEERVHPNLVSLPNKQISPDIDKFFNASDSAEIPEIKIHSMTERSAPPVRNDIASSNIPIALPTPPRPNIQRPLPPRPASVPPPPEPRPKYRVINPFDERIIEPRIQGNIVDLSGEE